MSWQKIRTLKTEGCGTHFDVLLLTTGSFDLHRVKENEISTASDADGQSSTNQNSQSGRHIVANPLNDLLAEAQQHIDKGEFEAAIPLLQKVIVDQPDFAYAHFQLAYAYTALKRPAEAQSEYERAIAADPKMAEAYLNLGVLLLDSNPGAAVKPLKKAVEFLPSQPRPRYLLAVAQDRAGDQAGAAESFEALGHLDPNDANAATYLGWYALRQNKPVEAEAKFRRALELQPKSRALKGLAQSLEVQKKPEAADAYREYLTTQPDDADARSRLIHLLVEQQQYDTALTELDHADAGHPPSADLLRQRADIQIAQKKWDDAIVTIQHAIALTPHDAQLHGGLGRLYMQKRDFPAAEKELKIAIQLDSKNIAYAKDIGSTYYLAEDYANALIWLDEVAKVETPHAGSWFIRGLCYDKLNQPKPALEAYQKFLAMDQNKDPDQVWQAQQRSKVLLKVLEHKK